MTQAPPTESTYEGLGEFHDLFMTEPWERLRPHVRGLFAELPATAIVADLGAGSGMGTRVLAQASRARIVALEPSLVMRSVLTARVIDNPDLADRVTVLDGALPADLDSLPRHLDGFLCAHMLGHLEEPDRQRLWRGLGDRLTPGAVGLVTTQERHEDDLARTGRRAGEPLVETRALGGLEYRAVYRDAGTLGAADRFSTTYQVLGGGELLREATFAGSWVPVSFDDLVGDLAGSGLRARVLAPGVAAITR